MWEVLNDPLNDELYEAFLRGRSQIGDHGFLLTAVRRCNLRPSERKVIEELISGKLRRLKHRPPSNQIHFRNVFRALRVLDIEKSKARMRCCCCLLTLFRLPFGLPAGSNAPWFAEF